MDLDYILINLKMLSRVLMIHPALPHGFLFVYSACGASITPGKLPVEQYLLNGDLSRKQQSGCKFG